MVCFCSLQLQFALKIDRSPSVTMAVPVLKHPIDSSVIKDHSNDEELTTTEAPITQIQVPPLPLLFDQFSCNWVEELYLCYSADSQSCVLVYGSRPTGSCILTQPADGAPRIPDLDYFLGRFCNQKQLRLYVGREC